MRTAELENLFRTYTGVFPEHVEEFSSSGSNRTYFRLGTREFSCIGVIGQVAEENATFCELAAHFASKGIRVPAIYAVSEDGMYYLQEDLGKTSLFDMIAGGRISGKYSPEDIALLKKTIAELPKIQIEGAADWDFSRCFHRQEFNERSVIFDLHYFKYCFLKATGLEYNEEALEDDFMKLKDDLLAWNGDTFMYRDFQSRNVMIRDGEPYFIDFQGGMKGPLYMDVASFVWQARSDFPPNLKDELVGTYIEALRRYRDVDEDEFRKNLRFFVFFRTLQVLAAYGFRGNFERKRHFLESIPYAVANLRDMLPFFEYRYPYMCEVFGKMVSMPRFAKKDTSESHTGLKVRIFSFSYRKGIPDDESGNGGGYVFDCRAIHNPGKYKEYKSLTGMDREVKEFLEGRGEVQPFLDRVYALADTHIEKYLGRGFTDLMFAFGCTGGQHRSVYCAEALAGHIASRYNIEIDLVHREQGIERKIRWQRR